MFVDQPCRTIRFLCSCLAVICLQGAITQAQDISDVAKPDGISTEERLPTPLAETTIRTIANQLSVEDPKDLDDAIKRYQDAWQAMNQSLVQRMNEHWPAAFQVDPLTGQLKAEWNPELLTVLEIHKTLHQKADSIDGALFEELAIIDGGDGVSIVNRLRRNRRNQLLGSTQYLPGSTVDLSTMLSESGLDTESIEELRPWLDDWEIAVDKATQARFEMLTELDWREAQGMLEVGPAWREVLSPADVMEIERVRQAYNDARVATELPQREANARAVARLLPLLPSEVSSKFARRYRHETQPSSSTEEIRLGRLIDMITEVIAETPDTDPDTTENLQKTWSLTNRRLADLDLKGLRENEQLVGDQLAIAATIAKGGEVPGPMGPGERIDERIDRVLTRIALMELAEERRNIVGEIAILLLGAVPDTPSGMNVRNAINAFIAANRVLDRADKWRRNEYEIAIGELEAMKLESPLERITSEPAE